MLTFRHHHFRKTFLSFVPHVPNKPKKEVQTTLFRVQKRFSITRSWLPKCSICTPSKKTIGTLHVFFLAKIPKHDQKKGCKQCNTRSLSWCFLGRDILPTLGETANRVMGYAPFPRGGYAPQAGVESRESSIGLQSFSFNYTSKRIILED